MLLSASYFEMLQLFFYIYFNLSSVSQSSLSGKFWVYKKVMLLPLLLLLGLFFLKVKLFLASVSSSRMVTCLLLVSFSIWRSVWFYFLFPVCVRVCVCVWDHYLSIPLHWLFLSFLSSFMLLILLHSLFFLSLFFFFYPPSLFFIILFSTSVMCPLVSQ